MADAEPTLAAGAPEPRAATLLVGHDDAERVLRQAWDSGRLAHAWLIHGPRGVGKATLAYRFARFVLAHGAFEKDALDPAKGLLGVSPESRLWRRIASGSHGGLFVLEPGYDEQRGRPRSEITVDEVRRLVGFLTLTPGEGIWRVAIVDSADALNRHAANALLKMLEEPPARVVFLLLSENPSALLATLRSRCRRLALRPVGTSEIERLLRLHRPELTSDAARTLAAIADGSPGQAIELAEEEGAELFGAVFRLIGELPELKTAAVHALAARASPRGRGTGASRRLLELVLWWLARLVRQGATGEWLPEVVPGERQLAQRLLGAAPLDRWVALWEKLSAALTDAERYNLDRKQIVLSAFLSLERAAQGRAAP